MKIINIKNKRNRSFSRFNESRYGANMDRMWDELLMMGVSEETLTTITNINGFTEDTLKDVLYASFGERSFEFEDEDEDEDDVNESRRHRGRDRSQNRRALIESLEDKITRMWDELLEMGVSEETLTTITSINGYNEDTLKDVLYASFGERSFEFEDEDEEDVNESRRHRGRRRFQNRRALIESLEDDMEGDDMEDVDMEDDDMDDDDMDDSVNVDLSASDISVLKKIVAAADEDYEDEDDDMEDEDFEGADEGGEDFDDIEDPYNSVNLVSMEDLPEKTPSENNTYYD